MNKIHFKYTSFLHRLPPPPCMFFLIEKKIRLCGLEAG